LKSANAIRKQKKRSARSAKEHTYHISAIEVEPKDRRKDEFHVLIDDVLYGPFTKIKYVDAQGASSSSTHHLSHSPSTLHFFFFFSFAYRRIGPVLSSKEPMACRSLPVMTYFPLDL
jgi:hypothetical protein